MYKYRRYQDYRVLGRWNFPDRWGLVGEGLLSVCISRSGYVCLYNTGAGILTPESRAYASSLIISIYKLDTRIFINFLFNSFPPHVANNG